MKIWLICIFQSHIDGGIAGVAAVSPRFEPRILPNVATVSHGLTRCQPGVSRMCHGVDPV